MAKNRHFMFFAIISVFCFGIICSCGQQTEIVPAPSKTYAIANSNNPVSETDLVFEAHDVLKKNFYDPEKLNYVNLFNAALEGVSKDLESKGVEYDFQELSQDLPYNEAKSRFVEEFDRAARLLNSAGHPSNRLVFSAVSAMLVSVGDSHTGFFTPEALAQYTKEISNKPSYAGIGVHMRKLGEDFYYFERIFAGSPAANAGIQKLDHLLEVNGESVAGKDFETVRSMIVGDSGTDVNLKVERKGVEIDFLVKRGNILTPSVEYSVLKNGANKLAYIFLYRFSGRAFFQVNHFIHQFPQFGIKGIVLDLRGCPGGELSALEMISELFLDRFATVYIFKDRNGSRKYITKIIGEINLPMVVLINDASFSAAEILAASLQNHKRAIIAGQKSEGLASCGQVFPLSRGAGMMVAIAQIFTPNGNLIEGYGVTPDMILDLTKEDVLAGRDAQLERAIEILDLKIANR